jgi:predicted transposase YbfD/YdcC
MSFIEHFHSLKDPRSHINKSHDLLDIIFLSLSALLSGAEGWEDIVEFGHTKQEWLKRYRRFDAGIPSDDTISRVMSALDPEQLMACFISWVNDVRETEQRDFIAIDGKTLRRSFDRGDKKTALHVISAWAHNQGLVLMQKRSEGKQNEIHSAIELIDMLELKNCIVTLDAMHCQTNTATHILAKEADYVLSVKGNQGHLEQEIQAFFHKAHREKHCEMQSVTEVDSGHGRIEERTCHVLPVSKWMSNLERWPQLNSVVQMVRKRHQDENISEETIYFISSLAPDPVLISQSIRRHWGVENQVHWVLDVTLREDDSRLRREHAPENIGALRRFVLNLVRLHPSKYSVKRKLQKAGWDDNFRAELLFG